MCFPDIENVFRSAERQRMSATYLFASSRKKKIDVKRVNIWVTKTEIEKYS